MANIAVITVRVEVMREEDAREILEQRHGGDKSVRDLVQGNTSCIIDRLGALLLIERPKPRKTIVIVRYGEREKKSKRRKK